MNSRAAKRQVYITNTNERIGREAKRNEWNIEMTQYRAYIRIDYVIVCIEIQSGSEASRFLTVYAEHRNVLKPG